MKFDLETTAFIESGCALIVGTVGVGNEPCASRGWGLTVLDEPGRIRLLLDAVDTATATNVDGGGALAITGASIRTLQSVQLKGRAVSIEPASPDDEARAGRYCDAMFDAIHETDFTPMALLEQLRPVSYLACVVVVTDVFNQTPGPGAGERLVDR